MREGRGESPGPFRWRRVRAQKLKVTAWKPARREWLVLGAFIVIVAEDLRLPPAPGTPHCSAEDFNRRLCPAREIMPSNEDTAQMGGAREVSRSPQALSGPSRPYLPTKFEGCSGSAAKQGLFLGIENIQPRIGQPALPRPGRRANDLVAPLPGFTPAQRLALLYVAASMRQGRWLVPAFHAVIDSRYADGHDDPQNFDMPAFSDAVKGHLDRLAS